MPGFFITGTDTNVGKTVITALLAKVFIDAGRKVAVYKPIQTGAVDCSQPDDLLSIQRMVDDDRLAVFNTYCFSPPVTPSVADTEGVINVQTVTKTCEQLVREYDMVLVEGAGGVMVPVSNDHNILMRDVMHAIDWPTIVVCRPDLGTINHTLLTVEALRSADVKIAGVIVSGLPADTSDPAIQTLPDVFKYWLSVSLLAYVPHRDVLEPISNEVTQQLKKMLESQATVMV